jgi:branched-chain amino acid transport system ATP-binding protein
MDELITVTDLGVSYGAAIAVRRLSFFVAEGDQISMVGANGAGKTSALLAVSGLLKPSTGSVQIGGTSTKGHDARWHIQQGVVLVPEGTRNFANMSVLENLRLTALALRRPIGEDDLAAVFDLFPILADRRKQAAGTLSGGEQKMLAIGRGLMARPRALLIDEPTLGLAPVVIERIAESLSVLRQRGIAIVIAEQSLRFVEAIGGRVMVIERGSCTWEGDNSQSIADVEQARVALLGRGTAVGSVQPSATANSKKVK